MSVNSERRKDRREKERATQPQSRHVLVRKTCRVSGIESEPSGGLQGWSTRRAERRDVETGVFLSFAS